MSESVAATDGVPLGVEISALAVGPWQQREFSAATSGLEAASGWPQLADLSAAYHALPEYEQPPELIFLAQPLPSTYSQDDIDRLQKLSPLTRLVIVVGSWCEGELRTGAPPTGVIRLYWYELATWWQAAIQRHAAGLCPLWSLPLDHPHSGRWTSDRSFTLPVSKKLLVQIDTTDLAVFETLAFALRQHGISASWRGDGKSVTAANAGIWDGSQLDARELRRLRAYCHETHGPVLALLDFPRVEHFEQAKAAGATAVFAKPYVVEELVQALATQSIAS